MKKLLLITLLALTAPLIAMKEDDYTGKDMISGRTLQIEANEFIADVLNLSKNINEAGSWASRHVKNNGRKIIGITLFINNVPIKLTYFQLGTFTADEPFITKKFILVNYSVGDVNYEIADNPNLTIADDDYLLFQQALNIISNEAKKLRSSPEEEDDLKIKNLSIR